MMLTGVEFKFLNYELNDNVTFPPKIIIAKSKYIFMALWRQHHFLVKATNWMKMLKNLLTYIKILKSDN